MTSSKRLGAVLGFFVLAAAALVAAPRLARSAADEPQAKAYAELADVMYAVNQGPDSVFAKARDLFAKGSLDDEQWLFAKGRTAMLCEVTNHMLKAKPPLNGDTPEGLAKWKKHIGDYRADAEAALAAATKKDCEAGKKALQSLGKRCNECHADHRKDE